ncbi:Cation/H+ exchanger [Corchorus capsularis]|uniref:Cation/H+ exchanger n=1 Tax=Corchorus capsularis TaxID=210143 RepID=A0A1R3IK73_COCAP|nr:Cation/H+ exchanger [Corchorus capsularis]
MIGILSFFLPIALNTTVAGIIASKHDMQPNLQKSIYFIAAFLSLNSFHVVVCLLADLKLLNSELGRLATSSSLISGVLSWTWTIITTTIMQRKDILWKFMSLALLIFIIVYIFRPVMLWMVRQTTEGRPVKEGHVWGVFIMILSSAFCSEIVGQHMLFGPMVLGMATPEGPPLGSALVSKLDSYVSYILLPSYFLIACSGINIRTAESNTVTVILTLCFFNFLAKLTATVLPSIYCQMPRLDALTLGLIMSAQGITDVLILQQGMSLQLIDSESFTIMALAIVCLTGIITPVAKFLYTPSRRFMMSNKRRTIQHSHPDTELRMLSGIYCQYQTPSIINLLELSNPTPRSPICFYVVHLQELAGRSTPLLVAHRPGRTNTHRSHGSQHMINAFRLYEENNEGSVVINLFTSISPYATMHEEVCNLAFDKRVSMVIVPFHKQWSESTQMEELPTSIRQVNKNILREIPCSVGILVDRGTLSGTSSLSSKTLYNIGMIFVEGPDDREALSYVMRMGEHPNVSVTLIRLVDSNNKSNKENSSASIFLDEDDRIVNDFKIAHIGKKYHTYKEELVSDSVETVGVIRSMENTYDLIVVGRRHDNESPLFMGLTEWNEFPELGFVGDMLASSDSRCQVSVLVVQQQTLSYAKNDEKLKEFEESSVFVDIPVPRKSNKIFPAVFNN